ncbi:hypothetical protein HO173_006656 [Letharia columbiana]|uniref:Uncharacterized protein n=1 Tax=Letharia columbiana TaxID=112416 RepID=A0A8H6L4B9_9LECA|nr:uncharacterized protein HO173_006656 [Letharia columbiana]KAF6235029.1 hypothetical protein HO173_006656 [Letharia columbiana]
MATTDVAARNVPPVDDLDDSLFDYDVGDVFRDVDTNMDVPAARADEKENGAGLGIDEEIKVTKKRAPVPKLDENRFAPKRAATVDRSLNGSQAPVTCWYPKATENCERAVEVQRERARIL